MYAIEEFAAAHDQVAAAIRAGDPGAAAEATGADWRTTAERHRELVAILGERGNW
jgi:DNA-binding GntR family transcriptional regulator